MKKTQRTLIEIILKLSAAIIFGFLSCFSSFYHLLLLLHTDLLLFTLPIVISMLPLLSAVQKYLTLPNSNNHTTALQFIPFHLTSLHFLFVATPPGAMTLNMTAFYMEDVFNVSVSAMKGSADAKQITIGAAAPIDYTLLCLTSLW